MNHNILSKYKTIISKNDFTSDEVMNLSEEIADTIREISTTKLRQYFDDIKGLARMAESAKPTTIKTKLRIIKSRIHYDTKRAGKKEQKSMDNLREFLSISMEKILTLPDSQIPIYTKSFSNFFEIIYGYFYFKSRK